MSSVLRQSVFYCQILNQVFKVSSGTCQQFVEDAVKISKIIFFLNFRLSQGSVATHRRWGESLCECVHREFSHESASERILKIGPHLPKLLSKSSAVASFFGTVRKCSVYTQRCTWSTPERSSNGLITSCAKLYPSLLEILPRKKKFKMVLSRRPIYVPIRLEGEGVILGGNISEGGICVHHMNNKRSK